MTEADLAQQITAGVAALKAGEAAAAVLALRPVWRDADLASAEDLVDVRARVGSLLTSALLEAGLPHEADVTCRATLRLIRQVGDPDAMTQVRGLQDRVVKALADAAQAAANREEAARVAATPIEVLLEAASDPDARAAALVRKAQACLDTGDAERALDLAWQALSVSRAHELTTWEVFARLVVVQADPESAPDHLRAAIDAAVRVNEFNLVSTIAQTARSAGIPLPTELL